MCDCDEEDDWNGFVWRVTCTESAPPFEIIQSLEVVAKGRQEALDVARTLRTWPDGPRTIVENVREANAWETNYQLTLF